MDGRVLLGRPDLPVVEQASYRRLGNLDAVDPEEQVLHLEVVVVLLVAKQLDDIEDHCADRSRAGSVLEHPGSKTASIAALVAAVETHPRYPNDDLAVRGAKTLYLLYTTLFRIPRSPTAVWAGADPWLPDLDDPGLAALFYDPLGKRRVNPVKIEEIMVLHGRPPLVRC